MLPGSDLTDWAGSDVSDGVGRITGEELRVSESLLFVGGGRGGILGVGSVLSVLLMKLERYSLEIVENQSCVCLLSCLAKHFGVGYLKSEEVL